jgi:hypothetical protein
LVFFATKHSRSEGVEVEAFEVAEASVEVAEASVEVAEASVEVAEASVEVVPASHRQRRQIIFRP